MGVVSLLIAVLPIVLILFIVVVVVKKQKNEKGGEDVFRQLYVYLVLFATLMMSIGGGIGLFMGAADLVSPTPDYLESYSEYRTQAKYDAKEFKTKFDEEQVKREYEQMIKDETRMTKEQARSTIINSLGFILIPLPIFLYFNKTRRNKEDI